MGHHHHNWDQRDCVIQGPVYKQTIYVLPHIPWWSTAELFSFQTDLTTAELIKNIPSKQQKNYF